jgi:hypothetical protein
MNNDLLNTDEFQKALDDYFYLIDHNYPEKGSLKLVGDRYQLSSELRTILYRGICSSQRAHARIQRLTITPERLLAIDGYNILFTLLNYRLGRFVFISNDNICRDAGSLFGKIKKEDLFVDCAYILVNHLCCYKNLPVIIYLDSPVSFSINHKQLLNCLLQKNSIDGYAEVVHSADHALKQLENCTLATSDSALIDACSNAVMDLSRQIIEKKYNAVLFNIRSKLDMIHR